MKRVHVYETLSTLTLNSAGICLPVTAVSALPATKCPSSPFRTGGDAGCGHSDAGNGKKRVQQALTYGQATLTLYAIF